METLAQAMEWLCLRLQWLWLIWFGISIVVGGILIARDEWRLHRARPKPEAVKAYADELEAAHGQEAYRVNGEAMYQARSARDFDRYRFLKEVSGELIDRLVSRSAASE